MMEERLVDGDGSSGGRDEEGVVRTVCAMLAAEEAGTESSDGLDMVEMDRWTGEAERGGGRRTRKIGEGEGRRERRARE